MKLVGIIGSIADESYNRKLMLYIASHFKETIDIEILDIRDVQCLEQEWKWDQL